MSEFLSHCHRIFIVIMHLEEIRLCLWEPNRENRWICMFSRSRIAIRSEFGKILKFETDIVQRMSLHTCAYQGMRKLQLSRCELLTSTKICREIAFDRRVAITRICWRSFRDICRNYCFHIVIQQPRFTKRYWFFIRMCRLLNYFEYFRRAGDE